MIRFAFLALLVSSLFFISCERDNDTPTPPPEIKGPDVQFYALTSSSQLVKVNANNPGVAISSVDITGLQGTEKLIGIDFRPNTGQLFGIGSASRLYSININTGRADTIAADPFTPALAAGTAVAFDFNPTVDRLRVITSAGVNIRVNPENGLLAANDGLINPGTPSITAAAYTNSFAGATTTTLYDIDITSKKLFRQDPPNAGTLVEVGPLGVNATGDAGFDISSDNSVALAALTVEGSVRLYGIELSSGKATSFGKFGIATVIDIAIPTPPVAYSIDDATNNLQIFNFRVAGAPMAKAITGLQAGETILGVDMRPKTGQLYGLGSTSRIYTINISTGVATVVGGQLTTLLSGTSFGFDFNPTVDRIRVISNTGQNLRLHPVTGAVAAIDLALNPVTTGVSAAAYTNNVASATTTVLYDIDINTDKLYMQNPPNNGTLVEVGNLGVNVTGSTGFDIGGTSGSAYALLTVGSSTKLYSINLSSGAAAALIDFPGNSRGFAIGLGF